MTKQIIFVTSNPNKITEARAILGEYNIDVTQLELDIDEVQSHDPMKITEAKVRSAYERVGAPIVVNDSSWEIPALNGFPGGYMKDVASWFEAEDFLALMKNKDDRRIILHDVVAYYDGVELKTFEFTQPGIFVDRPRGEGSSMNRVVSMQNSGGLTIAEEFARRRQNGAIDPKNYQHWQKFGEFLS